MKKKTLILAITIPSVTIVCAFGALIGVLVHTDPDAFKTTYPETGLYETVEPIKDTTIGIENFRIEIQSQVPGVNSILNGFKVSNVITDILSVNYTFNFYYKTAESEYTHTDVMFINQKNGDEFSFRFFEINIPIKPEYFVFNSKDKTVSFAWNNSAPYQLTIKGVQEETPSSIQ